ncbi:hypothetical protein ACVBEQ_18545 [Nakamurella sp. GG22]
MHAVAALALIPLVASWLPTSRRSVIGSRPSSLVAGPGPSGGVG